MRSRTPPPPFSALSANTLTAPHSHLFTTLTYTPSAALDARILAIFDEELQSVKTATGFAPSVVTQPLHANAIKAMRLRGGNALGVESEADATLTGNAPPPPFPLSSRPAFVTAETDGWISVAPDVWMERRGG